MQDCCDPAAGDRSAQLAEFSTCNLLLLLCNDWLYGKGTTKKGQ